MKTEKQIKEYIAQRLITVEAEMRQTEEVRRQDIKDNIGVASLNSKLNCLNSKRSELKKMHEFIIFG